MREVDYGDRKPLLKFISKEIKMIKYIDRYYLNWELYGIKFAGGGGWRQPWANTLLYLPLQTDAIDQSGNNRWTYDTWVTYTTVWWVASANFSWWKVTITNDFINTSLSEKTISAWVYTNFAAANNDMYIFYCCEYSNGFTAFTFLSWTTYIDSWIWWPNLSLDTPNSSYTQNQWFHIVTTCKDWTNNNKIYINWQQVAQWNGTSNPRWNTSATFNQWVYIWWSSNNSELLNGNISEFILEDKARTAQEVSDYYNQTKSLYGIS